MLKVVVVVDKEDTAIDRMAQITKPYLAVDYEIIAVHPKRPDSEQLESFERAAKTADIIDYQYFRTAEMLRSKYTWLKEIPSVLAHHNPYSIYESDWNSYQVVIANNKSIYDNLKKITTTRVELISNAVDPYYWKFNDDWNPKRSILMVANRIESKKGILPVAKVCAKLGIRMILVGNISDMGYFQEILATGAVSFAQDITDDELRDLYYSAGLHVCNSVDNFESGTNPILESIFCGTPVLTRLVGHVPEFSDDVFIYNGQPDDFEGLSMRIEEVLADKAGLERKRQSAWFAIKDRVPERRGFAYNKLYRELIEGEPVTIILPISDKPEITRQNLNAISNQTHKNIELIIIDDGQESQASEIEQFSNMSNLAIRYIRLGGEGYNLAKARNLGIIEATSEILVFCDQRMIMEPEAIANFVENIGEHIWLFGDKGSEKKEFVENFSCIYKSDIVMMGMFNERIDKYGGMSQEVRGRAKAQGFNLRYLSVARAQAASKSSNKHRKKLDIMSMKNLLWKAGNRG